MKIKLLLFILLLSISFAFGQNRVIDSLNQLMQNANNDTMRLVIAERLCYEWLNINSDTSLLYAEQYLKLSEKFEYRLNEADALRMEAFNYTYVGNYPRALEILFKALKTCTDKSEGKKLLPPVQVCSANQAFHKLPSQNLIPLPTMEKMEVLMELMEPKEIPVRPEGTFQQVAGHDVEVRLGSFEQNSQRLQGAMEVGHVDNAHGCSSPDKRPFAVRQFPASGNRTL